MSGTPYHGLRGRSYQVRVDDVADNGSRSQILKIVTRKEEAEAFRAARPVPFDADQRDNAPVFLSSVGTVIDPRNLTHRFEALVNQAHGKAISLHGMRHSHATLLLLQGEDMKTVSTRLGHASIQITLDTYAHVSPQMDQRTAEAIGRALAGVGEDRS